MKLSAPKNVTFYVALVLGALGILAKLIPLGFLTTYSFWLLAIGFIVLVVANLLPDL
ncbi:MAG: hypothetical protein ACK2T7_12870 [Anaerolineales bacterium]